MFDFHEKRKIRRVIYSRYSIGFLLFLALVLGRSVYERFTIEREMAEKLDGRTSELEALKLRAALLETKVEHLKNERGIEDELRSRFDVVKEGERVVILLDDPKESSVQPLPKSPESKQEKSESFFERLKFWK